MKVGDELRISYPFAVHYKEKGLASSKKGTKPINPLLWGDWAHVDEISGLLASTSWESPRYFPGYSPEDKRGMTLKILGPVPQELNSGKLALPKLGSTSACHHGSADISVNFLKATNPIATVISSGDNGPHSHPRPIHWE